MRDPFDPSLSFDQVEDVLPDVIVTAYADRAAHFFEERPDQATGRVVVLKELPEAEEDRQMAFLKRLTVDRIEAARPPSAAREAAIDEIVRARRGEDLPGAIRGAPPRKIERVGAEGREVRE
jgi:hypothetical protein